MSRCRRTGRRQARRLEPGMLIAGVIDDQLDHHLHVALVRRVEKRLEVVQGSVGRVDVDVVGDVVAVVAQRRGKERQEPDAGDAEVLQVVEPRQQSREIADAVAVRVGKGANVEFVDDRILVPERIGCAGDLLHAFTLRETLIDTGLLHAAHAQDVRGLNSRPQCNIVSIAPGVLRAAKQIIYQKAFMRGAPDLIEIEIGPASLLVQ